MVFELEIGYCSQCGPKTVNEDFCGVRVPGAHESEWGAIAAVADGVSQGGHGREAAQTTVHMLLSDFHSTPSTWDASVALERILTAHNAWLAGTNQHRAPAMGLTALTAVVLRGHYYTIAHVGDTRAYLLRQGQLDCLTNDHVLPQRDFSHRLIRAVGLHERLALDYVQEELQIGDVLILTTDGVHGVLRPPQWRSLCQEAAPALSAQALADALVAAALQSGGQDNASALVLRVLGLHVQSLHEAQQQRMHLPLPPSLRPGDTLEAFKISALVADNGIHRIYQVRYGERDYALKTLHPACADDVQERAMLVQEAWLTQHMQGSAAARHLVRSYPQHPNGHAPAHLYALYDWHRGHTLQHYIEHPDPQLTTVAQCVQWGRQALVALDVLHRQGVVHRDIKPDNLHWGDDHVLRLIDLGVALYAPSVQEERGVHTMPARAGTPSYINPEQWGLSDGDSVGKPQPPDARSDLFALGVTLYQMLTGVLPYGEVLPYQVGRYAREPHPASHYNPAVPRWLDVVLAHAIGRDSSQRFTCAQSFKLALERGAQRAPTDGATRPVPNIDPGWKLALGVSVLLNVVLIFWLLFLPQ